MQFNSVELVNFCNHRQSFYEFSPHLNVIVGPNGSGKSTTLKALTGQSLRKQNMVKVKEKELKQKVAAKKAKEDQRAATTEDRNRSGSCCN